MAADEKSEPITKPQLEMQFSLLSTFEPCSISGCQILGSRRKDLLICDDVR